MIRNILLGVVLTLIAVVFLATLTVAFAAKLVFIFPKLLVGAALLISLSAVFAALLSVECYDKRKGRKKREKISK